MTAVFPSALKTKKKVLLFKKELKLDYKSFILSNNEKVFKNITNI